MREKVYRFGLTQLTKGDPVLLHELAEPVDTADVLGHRYRFVALAFQVNFEPVRIITEGIARNWGGADRLVATGIVSAARIRLHSPFWVRERGGNTQAQIGEVESETRTHPRPQADPLKLKAGVQPLAMNAQGADHPWRSGLSKFYRIYAAQQGPVRRV